MESLLNAMKQFLTVFKELPPAKKAGVLAVLALVAASFVGLMVITGQKDYQVLFSRLSSEDAAAVVEKLKERRVPYRLAANGSTVLVPRDDLYETRLVLAGEGVPAGGGVGLEIFDETKIGATEFVQRINYQRALQGELARTINQFKQVESSRVHIVTPRQSLFVEAQKPTTAAVVLKLKGGKGLSQNEVQAIVNLVSSAVEGLSAENVTVVDTAGRVLYDKTRDRDAFGLTDSQLDYQRQLEANLAEKIQTLLAGVVGPGKSIAKVSAKIDFDKESLVEEKYDPDGAVVRSSQSTDETSEGQALRPIGSPDEQFKITAGAAAAGQTQSKFARTTETLNYEINKVNRKIIKASGTIDRLSVAVLIDGRYETKTGPDGKTVKTYVPRSEEELSRLTALIRSAVGYNEARGDVIEVSSMAFEGVPETPVVEPTIMDTILEYVRAYGKTALGLIVALLFFLFVVRPMIKWSGRELKEAVVEVPKLPVSEEETEAELEDLRRKMSPRAKAQMLVEQEPDMAIEVLKTWLHQTEGR